MTNIPGHLFSFLRGSHCRETSHEQAHCHYTKATIPVIHVHADELLTSSNKTTVRPGYFMSSSISEYPNLT